MSKSTTIQLPVLTILGIIFVTLKLMGYITWSWWWVTLPFWGGLAFLLTIITFTGFVYAVIKLYQRL